MHVFRTGHARKSRLSGWTRGVVFHTLVLLAGLFAAAGDAGAQTETPTASAPDAVILMYHRFGEDDYPSTNVRLEQFEAHIEELKTGGYTVLPLADIVDAIRTKAPLPPRAVAITIDDAYRSIYTEAWPRLKAAGFPFTVFVATEPVDRATAGTYQRYMTWEQVRTLQADGVGIGHHTVTHLHMPKADPDRNRREISEATQRYIDELGHKPTLFAYPYGEASQAVIELVREDGFLAAFGQHSGTAGIYDDIHYLPRFALNENYGDLERLRLVTSTHALPVADFEPRDMTIEDTQNPPTIGFTIAEDIGSLGALGCFVSGEGKVMVETLGDVRVEIRPKQPFPAGRTRLNCTMPKKGGGWYWFGRQFFVP